jgi:spermidine synthase
VLLGLGGAGIVHLLRATRPALKLDIVEIDGAVVALARQHFGYLARPGEQAFVQDAARFAKRPEQAGRHDLVMVDCFGESFIPPALLTAEFFRDVRGLLSPRGVLVANLWSTHPRHEAIVRQYGKFYPHIWLVPGRSSGNSILVASPNPLPDQATMIKRAHDLDSRSLVPFKVLPHAMRMRRP